MILDTSIYSVLLLVVHIVSGDAGGVQIEGIFAKKKIREIDFTENIQSQSLYKALEMK